MKLSIIIPTLNEAATIAETIAAASRVDGDREIIVVDGGSDDATVATARAAAARVIEATERGRANQMNRGAAEAGGDVLLFLHADTHLPRTAHSALTAALRQNVGGGCFRLGFDDPHAVLRASAFLSRFRFALFHYGDAAYFVRRDVFAALGGFNPLALFEDLDFWLRLSRKYGTAVAGAEVVTSARRFRRHGVVRLQALGALLVILFLMGVPPARLARVYHRWAS